MAASVVKANTGKAKVKRRRRRHPVLLGLALVVILAGGAALFVTQPWQKHPKQVAIVTIAPGPASRVLAVNGRVVAVTDVQLRSTVGGQVEAVTVQEGDQVENGRTLASLDNAQQKAATEQAQAALVAAEVQVQQAQANYDRAKALGDAISSKDLQSAQVSLQTAKSDVQRLSAALDQATSILNAYQIRAPFSGTILSRGIDPGQVIDTSTVLFEIADLDHLEVDATVDELYAGEIRRGLTARLRPAGSNQLMDATVTFISPTVDSTTGGRLVRIAVPSASGTDLPIGLTVNTNIVVDQRDKAITVPRGAVIDPRTSPAVLLVKSGKAVRTAIDFIDWPAGDLIVTKGLAAGDQLITDPTKIADGDEVAQKGS